MDQSVTNIFEYSNIRIYWARIFIRTFIRVNFVCTNIFGHSFGSNLFVRIYSDIRSWVCYRVKIGRLFKYIRIFVQFSIRIFIRTFVRVKFFIRIYSNIHSCKFFDTNIFGYSFVSKFLRMSHSASKLLQRVACRPDSSVLTVSVLICALCSLQCAVCVP